MKLLRWAAALAVLCVLLLGAGLVALRLAYPPERIRALALAKLQEALGRQVRIASVALGLRGIELGGLEISEQPDFQAGTFLKAKTLTAGWDARALLERRVAVSELLLAGFECRLARDRKGRLNAATLGAAGAELKDARDAPAAAPAARGPAAPAFDFSVRRIRAEAGTVTYQDADGARAELGSLRAEVNDFRPGAPFPASLAFGFEASKGGSRWKGSLAFDGVVEPKPDGAARVAFKPLRLELGGLSIPLEGEVSRDAAGAVALAARGPVPALDAAKLKALGASAPEGLSLPAGSLSLKAAYAGDRLRLEPLELALGESRVDVRGTLRLPGALELTVKASELPLELLAPAVPALAEHKVGGRASADLRVTGTASAPILAGTAKVAGLRADAGDAALTGAALDVSFDPKDAKATLKGRLGSGELSLDVVARQYASAPDVRVTGSLSAWDLGKGAEGKDAAPASSPPEGSAPPPGPGQRTPGSSEKTVPPGRSSEGAKPLRTGGTFEIGAIRHPNFQAQAVRLEWDLSGVTPRLDALTGRAKLRTGAGKLDDLTQLAAKSALAKVALLPLTLLQKAASLAKVPLLPAFDKVTFKELTGDYVFEKGVMTVKESHLDSSAGYVTTTGTADLGQDRLNLRIAAKVGGALQGRIAGPIAFFVRGSLQAPEVKADVAAILKQPQVEKALEGGKKLLQQLFKK
ncbi:MAG: AsmA family protein [Elusimicrobia bacterium]|nr:AsmA family protein [Elusimicrobiota bacterium]